MECAELGLRGGRGLRGPAEPDPADLKTSKPVLCRKPVVYSAEWLSLVLNECLQAPRHTCTAMFWCPAAQIALCFCWTTTCGVYNHGPGTSAQLQCRGPLKLTSRCLQAAHLADPLAAGLPRVAAVDWTRLLPRLGSGCLDRGMVWMRGRSPAPRLPPATAAPVPAAFVLAWQLTGLRGWAATWLPVAAA